MEHVDRAVAAHQMEALDVQCMAFMVPHELLGMYAMCITILHFGFKNICWCLYKCLLFRVASELQRYSRSVCIRGLQACTHFPLSCKDHKSLRPSIAEALMLRNIVNKINDGSIIQLM